MENGYCWITGQLTSTVGHLFPPSPLRSQVNMYAWKDLHQYWIESTPLGQKQMLEFVTGKENSSLMCASESELLSFAELCKLACLSMRFL